MESAQNWMIFFSSFGESLFFVPQLYIESERVNFASKKKKIFVKSLLRVDFIPAISLTLSRGLPALVCKRISTVFYLFDFRLNRITKRKVSCGKTLFFASFIIRVFPPRWECLVLLKYH